MTLSQNPPKVPYAIYLQDDDTGEVVETLYEPTPKQIEFHSSTEPNVLYIGARGTGKSHALRWEAHSRALAYPGFKYVILRRTYPELLKSHIMFIEAEMKKLGGTWNTTNKLAKYANGSVGFYSHCESEADVLNLLSAEFFWMGFDEMSTFPWEMITKLAASCRVPTGSGLVALVRGATNPLGQSASELNRYYFLKDIEGDEDADYVAEDFKAVHTVMGDNPHIDIEQYKKRFAGQPEHIKRAWLLGEFMEERTLFRVQKFRDGEPWHIINELPTWHDGTPLINQPWVRVYRAYDDGFFPDPAVCVWFMVVGKRIIAFKEKTWIETNVKDIAADIIKESKGMKVVATYCDPKMDVKTSGAVFTTRQQFERCKVPMTPSINDREMFAKAINNALVTVVDRSPQFQMYVRGKHEGVPYLAKYLPQMKWDENNPKKMADHKHDHPVVCCAYFFMSFIPETKEKIKQTLPAWMKAKKTARMGNANVRRKH